MKVFRHFLLIISCFVVASAAVATSIRAVGASIYINEVEAVKLRTSSGGRSPAARAEYLAGLLEVQAQIGVVKVVPSGKGYEIFVGDRSWVVITAEDAKAAGSSPKSLAESWSSAIRSAAALPALKIAQAQIKAPPGSIRTVAIVGSHVQDSSVRSSDEKVISVKRNGSSLVIQGVAPGRAQAELSFGSETAKIEVTVQPMAAYFPQSLVATVTGTPASRDTVVGSLVAALNSDLRAVDGAQANFTPPDVTEISTGDSRTYQVRVRMSGPESFPSEGLVNVTVKNSPISYRSEAELWYSNDPEPVKKPMRLFAAGLKPGTPVRLLYHHINVSGSPMIMNIEAINNTATPAKVLIMPGDADPGQNPVVVGFEAADRFLKCWSKYSGEVVDIPPFSILPISLRNMGKRDTISGLCYLRLLDGGPEQLIVRAEARRPSLLEPRWKLAMASATPWRITGTKKIGDLASVPMPDSVHIYPHPFKDETVAYSVGGPYGFVRIGQIPIARQDNKGSLDGNFGVFYTITANIENTTSTAAEVEVVYEASAGYGGALFLIDGAVRRTPMLQPKQETRVSRFKVGPNSSKSLRILTVPLSGSSYPCTLTIRPVQVLEGNNRSGKP